MNKLINKLKKNELVRRFSSLKITVSCLSLLFILTLWGTVAQVQDGLYAAQQQFFHSFVFLAFGFLPFPGAQLVLWILFFNLVSVSITRFVYNWSHLGILIIHFGLLTYFLAAFVTFHVTEESNITLLEGNGTNLSSAYHAWELSIWKDDVKDERNIIAYDTKSLRTGDSIHITDLGLNITVKDYYHNAEAYAINNQEGISEFVNDSGIRKIVPIDLNIVPEQNIPGGVFMLNTDDQKIGDILLYGGEHQPTSIQLAKGTYYIMLRRKRFELPFTLILQDFEKQMHPGTEVARSYQSRVDIKRQGLDRNVLIYMNHPFRYKDYTLYQASYAIDAQGREYSTLAVVKNAGRLLPYMASLLTFVGLMTHFLTMAFNRNRKVA